MECCVCAFSTCFSHDLLFWSPLFPPGFIHPPLSPRCLCSPPIYSPPTSRGRVLNDEPGHVFWYKVLLWIPISLKVKLVTLANKAQGDLVSPCSFPALHPSPQHSCHAGLSSCSFPPLHLPLCPLCNLLLQLPLSFQVSAQVLTQWVCPWLPCLTQVATAHPHALPHNCFIFFFPFIMTYFIMLLIFGLELDSSAIWV